MTTENIDIMEKHTQRYTPNVGIYTSTQVYFTTKQ